MGLRTLSALLAVAFVAACGDDTASPPADETTTVTTTVVTTRDGDDEIRLDQQCDFTVAGWEVTVSYPGRWEANEETETETGTVPACRIFDPEDPVPPRATELNAFAVLLDVDAVDFDDIGGDPLDAEVVERDDASVSGRSAVRREDRLTEDGIRGPAGARVTTYVVDLDGSVLIARTHEVADLDYERNRDVLDAMMDELSIEQAQEVALPGGELVPCENPEGFTLGRPESWSTNPGEVVPTCSQLHPEPFEVPEGTDERVAAITAYVEPVAFAEVAAPDSQRNADRAVTTIHGLQAVRLEYETDGGGLWPAGTPITVYAIDLSPGVAEDPETLVLDTIGLEGFDYERNQVILDRVARSLVIDREGVPTDAARVARYEGGGSAFSVAGDVEGAEACLRIRPEGERVCTEQPPSDEIRTVQLVELEPVLAGIAGIGVFRVTAELRDGPPSSVLPAPIPDADVGGFAFTFDVDAVERLTLFGLEGRELGTIEPGG